MNPPNTPEQSPLGHATVYPERYDASLLFPIARAAQREALGVRGDALPFFGADLWTAFELSWLNARGKPQLAIAHFTIPCETPNIIESKSFKLYLNSFNNSVFADAQAVRERLVEDLSLAVWQGSERSGRVGVKLLAPEMFDREPVHELDGLDIDRLDLECTHQHPAPELLSASTAEAPVTETLTSRLLKSNCPVTGQPDWGSVQIRYSGPQIDQAGLLRYIVSFRGHNDFHEHCVERIFQDITARCRPTKLSVYARYTRRGGLDINPFRTSWPQTLPPNVRTARQ
ncbi:NADPH-dependent 7-cyano-7-deazaguanine reductase QueF [Variovorax dokdonensis]|uniref:NADPH-dependent 7-cyano-7-deazaguanine reductase n=1 Tax=Variovorax dokdonensis TaxID=344883 RepID=A0ABT7N6E7_9BURK|nr:NADPH-dependent 7-cyano-7-deazaguanine reductase QueF [Variovorax dokdonensis]MDM0043503.1 NADPH-dependent 7-cyano-7-deazaguanine reductase QueF [Variovorax dokdonensis]